TTRKPVQCPRRAEPRKFVEFPPPRHPGHTERVRRTYTFSSAATNIRWMVPSSPHGQSVTGVSSGMDCQRKVGRGSHLCFSFDTAARPAHPPTIRIEVSRGGIHGRGSLTSVPLGAFRKHYLPPAKR